MKAVVVTPGVADSLRLEDVATPRVHDIDGGRGVLVRVLRVGVDGTDKEINDAEYGKAPDGDDYLIIGHESFGVVEEVGENVSGLEPGDHVAAVVRRPGGSIYDRIGLFDMTTDEVYYERGINKLHGFLAEYYVEDAEYVVKVPRNCGNTGVLMEPMSIAQKGVVQAYEIQRRMKVWRPARAAVVGPGTLGLLALMALRLRGLGVTAFGRKTAPHFKIDLIESIGAHYVSTMEQSIADAAKEHGPFDIIFEATGNSGVAFESADNLGRNGVLILSSITGGNKSREIPADRINLEFVLGNKLMFGTVNANRSHFESAARDLTMAAAEYPGWLDRLLTHPVQGLENYGEMMEILNNEPDAIKVYVDVAA